jgi:hypothetical protein
MFPGIFQILIFGVPDPDAIFFGFLDPDPSFYKQIDKK